MERGRLVLPLGILAAIGAGLIVWLARDEGSGATTPRPVAAAAEDARAKEAPAAPGSVEEAARSAAAPEVRDEPSAARSRMQIEVADALRETPVEDDPGIVLQVQVLDAKGAPVIGIPVELRHKPDFPPGMPGSHRDLAAAATEAPDGIARFEHVEQRLQPGVPRAFYLLGVNAVLAEPVEVPVDLNTDEPVVLQLPPTGRVIVGLPEEARNLGDPNAWVRIQRPPAPLVGTSTKGFQPGAYEDGRAVFAFVGLDQELVVTAHWPGLALAVIETIAGPVRAGGEVVLELASLDAYPRVTGRVVRAGGEPVASRIVGATIQVVYLHGAGSWRRGLALPLDASGRFRIAFPRPYEPQTLRTLEVSLRSETHASLVATGAVDLSAPLVSGTHDVGDIVLTEAPLFAQGRVVDPDGRPVGGAQVTVGIPAETGFHDLGASHAWISIASGNADAGGRFHLFGWNDPSIDGERRIYASHDRVAGEPVVLEPGATGLELVVPRGGGVAGSLLLDDDVPRELIDVVLQSYVPPTPEAGPDGGDFRLAPARSSRQPRWTWRSQPDDDGRFSLDRVTPGAARVTIRLRGENAPLLTVEDIEIRSGAIADPPELQRVDLTRRLQVVRVAVVDTDGDPIRDARLRVAPDEVDDQVGGAQHPEPDGTFVLLTRRRPLLLEVEADGHRRVTVEGVGAGEHTVGLPEALAVRLVLAHHAELPDPPHLLGLRLWLDGELHRGAYVTPNGPTALFQGTREAALAIPTAGTWRVDFFLRRHDENLGRLDLPLGASQQGVVRIEVLEARGEQILEIAPPAERIRQVIEQHRR